MIINEYIGKANNSRPKYNIIKFPLDIIIIIPNIDNKHSTKNSPLKSPMYDMYFLAYKNMKKELVKITSLNNVA
jgi:hypothetical protein